MLKKRFVAPLVLAALVCGGCDEGPATVTDGKGDIPAAGAAPADSPVATHGALQVTNTAITNASGAPVQLKGVSSMWLNWEMDGYAGSRLALKWMRDNWRVQVIRAAMGVEPSNGYLSNRFQAKTQVRAVIENAIREGVYVLVDWHDHNAHLHQEEAEAFFDEMSRDYGEYPNVIYEPFNEPEKVDWSTDLKPYHEAIIAKIRANDPDNIIVLGTPIWSQEVDAAAADPVQGSNLMYTLHFYACTHTDWLRAKGSAAIEAGLPLFVTEWGATHADGGTDGKVCDAEADAWHAWMNENQVSWAAWKLDGCKDSSCLLKEGAPVTGGWTDDWLQGHGSLVRSRLLE
jgi:endoglucanase